MRDSKPISNQTEITLNEYQARFATIIKSTEPWQSPDGSTIHDRQVILTDGTSRVVKVDGQMGVTLFHNGKTSGIDKDFSHETRLMEQLTQPKQPKQPLIVILRINEIILDPKINTRDVDSDIVVEYKDAISGYGDTWQDHWNELPRITESNHLWSGFHTINAARLVFGDRGKIKCVIEGKNERDAYFLATKTNTQHGRRRTNAEKEIAVLRWLEDEEMCQWTDGHIADQCRVSGRFVGKCRLRTVQSQPAKRKFINAKGEIEWMHTTRIGKTSTPPAITPAAESPKSTDLEYQQIYDYTVAKADKAIRTYEEKQESLGLSKLPWYGEGGFFYYAKAEFEKQEKQFGYAHYNMTINQLSELTKLWESVTNAIKHNANWIKAVVQEVERKAEIEEKAKLRKTLLDEIIKLQIHQVSPLLPEQYRDEWRESKAGLKAAYPLYFSYSNRNNLPIEKLTEMKRTLLRMKKDLQENGIAKFLSDDYKERAAAHGELTQAYHKAKNAFNAHPLAEHMEFDDFDQEVEFHLELEESLLSPDYTSGLEVKDLRRLKHLWDKIAKGLEHNVSWVQKILGEAEEGKERVEATEAAQASMDAAKESFLENREALGLAEVSWEDFEERAIKEFKRRSADTLRSPSDQLVWSRVTPPAKLCYLGSLWNRLKQLTIPPAQDWVAEYADEVKRGERFGEVVSLQGQAQEIWREDLRGYVYWDAFKEAIAANIGRKLGEPITAAASVEELTEHIELWERALEELKAPADWVTALKESDQANQKAVDSVTEQEAAQPSDTELQNERALCGGHIAAAEHDFEQLKQKYRLQADFQDFYVYACEYFEEERNLDLSRYTQDLRSITRIAELRDMWKTVVDDLGSEPDWIKDFVNRFKTTEMDDPAENSEQPTPLQIEPLGPADSTPPETNKPQMEVADQQPSFNFKDLGWGTKGNIRGLARSSKSLLEEDDLPDDFKAILSNLLNMIVDFAESDELLKKILERD